MPIVLEDAQVLRSSSREVPWEVGWFKPLNAGGFFVKLHQNNNPEMIIWKLEVAAVQGSCRSGAIQVLDSTNAFLFFVLDHRGYKSLCRTRNSDESASFPGFAIPVHLSCERFYTITPCRGSVSATSPGSVWRQPATGETSWAPSLGW